MKRLLVLASLAAATLIAGQNQKTSTPDDRISDQVRMRLATISRVAASNAPAMISSWAEDMEAYAVARYRLRWRSTVAPKRGGTTVVASICSTMDVRNLLASRKSQ